VAREEKSCKEAAMRDHTKLKVFELADRLAIQIL
jgi:hypothetical protein